MDLFPEILSTFETLLYGKDSSVIKQNKILDKMF